MASPKRKLQLDIDTQSVRLFTPDTASSTASPSPQSKRSRLDSGRLKLVALGAEMSCKGRPKGKVRYTVTGELEHLLESERIWVPAMYHNDIRAGLIKEAAVYGQYDHPRIRGKGATDETAYLPAHKTWGPAEKDWPEPLLQSGSERKPESIPAEEIPFWYRDGCVLLDDDNDPMRFLPDTIPATCSSEMEDWELQAICFSDPRIVLADVRGRMPKTITQADGSEKPLFKLNAISMKMTRFRTRVGLSPQRNASNSPKKFQAHEEARQIQKPTWGRRKNKRLPDSSGGSEDNSDMTGSPTKKARRPRLKSISTISDDYFPKLTRSESSALADYIGEHGTLNNSAALETPSPQDLLGSPVRFPGAAVGLGLDFQMFPDVGVTKTKGHNTNFIHTPRDTPKLGHSAANPFGLDDPFYDGFLQQSANISPKSVIQRKARPDTGGDIFMPEESVADIGFAQNETISNDLTEFLATLSPIVGDGIDAMYSDEQILALENESLSTDAASAVEQTGGISNELAEFLAKLDAQTGYNNDGASKHAMEQTSPTEQTGTAPLLTKTASADVRFEQNGGISADVAEFLAQLDAAAGYNSNGVREPAGEQTSPLKQTEDLALFTAPASANTAIFQDETNVDFLAQLDASRPNIIGHRFDGTPIYETELTSSLAPTENATLSTNPASKTTSISQSFPLGFTEVSPESDTVTTAHSKPASQESTSASSVSPLCNENDLIPSWDEGLPFFEPLENLIARGVTSFGNRSTNIQKLEPVEVAAMATVSSQASLDLDEAQLAALADLPDIIGIDQYGAAIWADGFRFEPVETVSFDAAEPNAQIHEPLEPQYSLTINDFTIDDDGNVWVRGTDDARY